MEATTSAQYGLLNHGPPLLDLLGLIRRRISDLLLGRIDLLADIRESLADIRVGQTSSPALLNFLTTAGSSPFGPKKAVQVEISGSGRPASSTVGMLGSAGGRVGAVTAKALMVPPFT